MEEPSPFSPREEIDFDGHEYVAELINKHKGFKFLNPLLLFIVNVIYRYECKSMSFWRSRRRAEESKFAGGVTAWPCSKFRFFTLEKGTMNDTEETKQHN